MAEIEHPEKYNWWPNELDSLGISTLEKNGINNRREASDLIFDVTPTLGKPESQQNLGFGYIRQIHEHVFPTVRYLHLSTKAKR
jgi:hypothetical protein